MMKIIQSNRSFLKSAAFSGVALFSLFSCGNRVLTETENSETKKIEYWLTKGDGSVKLQQQNSLQFSTDTNSFPVIEIDESQKFQTVDGFGYTLTGGSVQVINTLAAEKRKALLNEFF